MKNILVAIDYEKETARLINEAAKFGKLYNAKVWVVHIAAPEPDFVGYDVGPQYIRDTRADELREEHKTIQRFVDELQHDGIQAEGLLVEGPTVEMIMKEAQKLTIDLIIIGSHRHSFLYNAFLGSTTEKLLRKSEIPILVIPLNDTE